MVRDFSRIRWGQLPALLTIHGNAIIHRRIFRSEPWQTSLKKFSI